VDGPWEASVEAIDVPAGATSARVRLVLHLRIPGVACEEGLAIVPIDP
jgi:hypothetical protein